MSQEYKFHMYESPEQYGILRLIDENKRLCDAIGRLIDNQNRLAELIKGLQESIKDIRHSVYELAPELEIIDTLADDPEERERMIEIYMNHNDDYAI